MTIIFATDFSQLSRKALRYAVALARKTGTGIIGTYALQIPAPIYSLDTSLERHEKELKQNALGSLQWFFNHAELDGVRIETRLIEGLPAEALNRLAQEVKADFVIVARHSRSRLEQFFIGSCTERILRESRLPVLVVSDRDHQTVNWQPIVCAVDFSAGSKDALHFSIQLARRYAAELVVVHVVDPGIEQTIATGEFLSSLQRVCERAHARLERLVKTHGAPPGTKTLVVEGRSASIVLDETERLGSDLLVIAKKESIQSQCSIGANASAIVRTVHVPVLVVPPGYVVT